MNIPKLPAGIELLEWARAAEGQWFFQNGRVHPGPSGREAFVVEPSEGYEFTYDVATDGYKPSLMAGVTVEPEAPRPEHPEISMNFPRALHQMKAGKKLTRPEWKGNTWLEMIPDMMPHLAFMPGKTVWAHTRADMIALDWVVMKRVPEVEGAVAATPENVPYSTDSAVK